MSVLLPLPPAPRRPRRKHARCVDAGPLPTVEPGATDLGRFACDCGYDEWHACTRAELRRGIACPACVQDPTNNPTETP